jgi:hypothetical protein
MEIIGFIIIEFIFSAIGWLCLLIWYRDRKKIKKIRDEEYAGKFGAAGRIFILNLIAGTGAITMFGIVITILVTWIYRSIVD